jgi:hypothetical protein
LSTFPTFVETPAGLSNLPSVNALVCSWILQSSQEISTRATQIHVANVAGASEQFTVANNQDATITAGLSVNGGPFSVNGSVGITNSVGSGGGVTDFAGTITWGGDHVYYGKYFGVSNCQGQTLVTPTSSAGDAYNYGGTPGANPWGGCLNDSHGHATINAHGFFWRNQGTGDMYSLAASAFGFSVSASYGFNSNVRLYWASTTTTTYVCGTGTVQTTGLYNTP